MTIVWFAVWVIASLVGNHQPLVFDPPNWWAGTLLLAIALDLNRPPVTSRRNR